MNAKLLIEKKRTGERFSREEINYLIENFVAGDIPDYQIAALLMAIFFQGMSFDEIFWLTDAMLNSGKRLTLDTLHNFPVDKHSTGGVGDKVSLILAPLVAAAGVAVPMMSGRGLGHSGGTLDKLEAIPGFRTALSLEEFVRELEDISVAMIGQTDEIVPADRKIYALRDSTGTVPSLPLIVASIMSKKIAEGAKGLVLDVKTGKGAFLKTQKKSLALAEHLIAIGERFGVQTTAFLTAMDQPLGYAVGNWLETREAIETLKGEGPPDLLEVTLTLSAEMLLHAKIDDNPESAKTRLLELLQSGKPYEKFVELVEYQGGDVSVVENPEKYPQTRHRFIFSSARKGMVEEIDSFKIGVLANELGAGRSKMSDRIDHGAGILFFKKEGDEVEKNEPIAELFFSKALNEEVLKERMNEAITVREKAKEFPPKKMILQYVSSESVPELQTKLPR
ncbi:MAG: thymidine phosphorylase [Calditrichaeota bacterium]|nr:thymidine phosphorylase [Calditrichota bacterium]